MTSSPVRFFTPGVWVIAAIAAIGAGALVYRFTVGLGSATNLSNDYPWGIWIAIDVACGVALAAGGFTTAFLAHVVHRETFHPIVRPALLTAMIGYTFVALGVTTDIGRYWAIWHVLLPTMWQGNSVLFEVAICVMSYLTVLYIEFLPVVCERFIGRVRLPGPLGRFDRAVDRLLRTLDAGLAKVMTVFIILGVLLSCMHQSSLGTLMVVAGNKLHPLWQTPMLPMLFLLSAFAVGFPMVIFESLLASRSLNLPPERHVLGRLARYIPVLLGLYFAAKLIDLLNRGALGYLIDGSLASLVFLVEIGLGVIVPFFILVSPRRRQSTRYLMIGASLVIFGVVLNRLNVFLIGYTPTGGRGTYFPAWPEIAVTLGFIAMIVLLYRAVVFNFPVIEHFKEQETCPGGS
jgi:Ni/Fe-hydrogenase subunit HybB-like protein